MNKLRLTIPLLFICLLGHTQSKNFLDQPYLEVTGSADTLVTPNEIYIKIQITEKDTKDKISVEELERKMYEALKGLGTDVDKNLKASDMASNFKFYFLRSKDVIKSKQYLLKVGDAVTASKVFIELENIGISNTSIDRVDHSDLNSIKNYMRTKAVENASTRAIAMTKPLKQTIGPAIHIADNENYNLSNQLQGNLNEVIVTGYGGKRQPVQETPKIEFEKIRIAANISVKFILKP